MTPFQQTVLAIFESYLYLELIECLDTLWLDKILKSVCDTKVLMKETYGKVSILVFFHVLGDI